MPGRKICGASMRAAIVIAAGSVMNEPNSGTAASPSHADARGVGKGARRASACVVSSTACTIGRDAEITITTKTNSGSV